MEPFIGEIKAVGWNFAARGYAMCNGQILGINQNTALFSLLGTTYGGNGQTTFNLPNLQGRVPIHQGQSPGTSLYSLGEVAGTESVTLTINQLPTHIHQATTVVTPSSTPITAATTINGISRPSARQAQPGDNLLTSGVDANGTAVNNFAAAGSGTTVALAAGSASTAISGGVVSASAVTTINPAGNNLPLGILQPYLVVTYLIALVGVFPSRN